MVLKMNLFPEVNSNNAWFICLVLCAWFSSYENAVKFFLVSGTAVKRQLIFIAVVVEISCSCLLLVGRLQLTFGIRPAVLDGLPGGTARPDELHLREVCHLLLKKSV